MRKSTTTLISMLALCVVGNAHAAGIVPETQAAAPHLYLGAKGGIMSRDDEGNADYDYGLNVGVYGGYNFFGEQSRFGRDLGGGTFSAEGEFTFTLLKGDLDVGSTSGDWNVLTLAAYGAYRIPVSQSAYLKGRAGLRWMDVDTSPGAPGSGTDTGLSFGIGAGFNLGGGILEPELTVMDSDLIFLSVGFLFN